MRLLALVTDAFGGLGGIARYNQDLMLALTQSDRVSEIVVLPRSAAPVSDVPAKVRQVAPSAGRVAWSARALALAAQQRFDAVFLEAAASGLPVIGGNCDGSADALADGRIGRLIDPHAPAEIEGAVIDALLGHHPVPAGAEETRRFAFDRFAAHVDAVVGSLLR
jgi:hypothetical protein